MSYLDISLTHIVNFIIGNKNDNAIKSYNHEQHSLFGIGKEKDKLFWKSLVRLALVNGYLFKNIEKYGLLSINEAGVEYIKNPKPHEMSVDDEYENVNEENFDSFKLESVCDEVLFSDLKEYYPSVLKKAIQKRFMLKK